MHTPRAMPNWAHPTHAPHSGRHHDYVRHWVPELALLPDVHLLAPWGCSASELAAAGVTLGVTYPQRVTGDVGLAQLREGSADAVRAARAAHAGKWVDRRGNDLVVAPKVGVRGVCRSVKLQRERERKACVRGLWWWKREKRDIS